MYKYGPRRQLAGMLGMKLLEATRRSGPVLDGLAYIPLHPVRLRARGFNQAELLARKLATELRIPLVDGLERIRDTPAQVGLHETQRRQNVAGAFRWTAAQKPPAALGLVDDVCTTGATLEAAAVACRRAGGGVAAFLVLASPQTLPPAAVTSPGKRLSQSESGEFGCRW